MKRIAILTLVFNNYGTRLQSYALCKVLNRVYNDKIEVCVIDFKTPWKSVLSSIGIKNIIFKTIQSYGLLKAIPCIVDMLRWKIDIKIIEKRFPKDLVSKRNMLFEKLIQLIPYSRQKYEVDEIRNGILEDYDGFIVGSDQVWNSIKVPLLDVFMLDFVKEKSKCLTYAASFGMTNIPSSHFMEFQNRINNFSSLLVREEEAVKLCDQLGRNDARIVLDPTLLLKAEDYSEILNHNDDYNVDIEGKYILVYSLNQSYMIYDEAYKLCKNCGYKMVVLKRSICPPQISKYKNSIELYAVSPGNFLKLIRDAECVITNSYHALLFSINYNSDFYLILNNADEENSRLLTVLRSYNLLDRVYWERESLPKRIKHIDYEKTNEKLEKERSKSIKLLKKSIDDNILN